MKPKIIIGIAIISFGVLIYFAMILLQLPRDNQEQTFLVVNIIDGDTFEIATGEQVRLICIDAPEKGEESYKASKNFLSSLVLGEEVRLEQDVEDKDGYGRLLRYVYLNITSEGEFTSEEELFINKEIVQKGYAVLFPYGNSTSKCDEIAGKN